MNWKEEEMRICTRFLQEEEVPAILTQLFFLFNNFYMYGFALTSWWPLASIVLTRLFFKKISKLKSDLSRVYAAVGVTEITQLLIISATLALHTEGFIANVIFSTTIMIYTEITPLFSIWFNVAVAVKHFMMWGIISTYLGISHSLISWSLIPFAWSILCIICYLTAKTQLLAKAKCMETRSDEQTKLVSLVLAIPDGVVVVTEDKRIAAYNHMFLEQMGLNASISYEELYQDVSKLTYDQDYAESGHASLEEDILQFIKTGGNSILNFKPLLVNGRHLEWRGKVGQWDGKMVCIATVRDSSQWVALEKRAKLESYQKTALLRSVSHELRTPANAIINQAISLQESAEPKEKEDLEVIVSATKLLLSMIGDLLDFSQMTYSTLKLTKSYFPLRTTIEECVHLIDPHLKAKSLGFRFLYDELLPELVYTDENRLKQVILHILSNAVK